MDPAQQPTQPMPVAPVLAPNTEEFVGRWRRHWIVLLRQLLLPLILTLFGFIAFLVVNTALTPSPTFGVPDALTVALTAFFLALPLIGLLWAIYVFWEWWSTWVMLTTQRLVVRESTPLRHETRREIPLDKIQNVISQLDNPLYKTLGLGTLTVGTASFGTISFHGVRDPNSLRVLIQQKQKDWQATLQPGFDTWLKESVLYHSIYGAPMPKRPSALTNFTVSQPQGYDTFNRLFPRRPQRDGSTVIWHKHWWFLVQAEAWPILVLVLLEGTNILFAVLLRLLGSDQNPLGDFLAIARPFVWFFVLLWMIYQWEDWRNDYYKVQGDSLIDYEARPLGFGEETKETKLDRITDLRVDQPNPLSFILRYGDIVIKVPGESAAFTFDGVPNPDQVLGEIMERIDAQQKRKREQQYEDYLKVLRFYTAEIQAYQAQAYRDYQAWLTQQPQSPPIP